MSLYCTLADVRAELEAENTVDDAYVFRTIRQLSRRIDGRLKTNNLFVPVKGPRKILINGSLINSTLNTLSLRTTTGGVSPLLSLTSADINGSALTLGANVNLYPTGTTPAYELQLTAGLGLSWYGYCSDMPYGSRYVTVDGVWGYNDDYEHAWLNTTTLTDGIDAAATSFEVTDFDGPNAYGDMPSISAGHVIQIDTEWMDVIATSAVTDDMTLITTYTLTVVRGVNGSTAAAHMIDAVVAVYQMDESIRRLIARQTVFQYARKGAFNGSQIADLGNVQFPPDMLQEANNLLAMFSNM